MTDAELLAKIEHLEAVHPKEIGLRAGEAAELLRELLETRVNARMMKLRVRGALRQLEASEAPFYAGMTLLKEVATS